MTNFIYIISTKFIIYIIINFLAGLIIGKIFKLTSPKIKISMLKYFKFILEYSLIFFVIFYLFKFFLFYFYPDLYIIYCLPAEGEDILNNSTGGDNKIKISASASVTGENVEPSTVEAIKYVSQSITSVSSVIKESAGSLMGLSAGAAAVSGAKIGAKIGGTPLQKITGAAVGGLGMTGVWLGGVTLGTIKAKSNTSSSSNGAQESQPNINTSDSAKENLTSQSSTQAGSSNIQNENLSMELYLDKNTSHNLGVSDNIFLLRDDSLNYSPNLNGLDMFYINSPSEYSDTSRETVLTLLNSILTLNGCSVILLLILCSLIMQFLFISKGYQFNFLKKLPFGTTLQNLMLKYADISQRNLLIFIFVFWLLILIFNFFSFIYLNFFIKHLDTIVEMYLNKR